ncbi:MAG: hypothetical protein J6X55_14120, partial [Victivallales bacterium]|nr:hypothetical protein [Victivallales bacterium]
MTSLMEKNHVFEADVEMSLAGCPASVFFLEEPFIREYYVKAELAPEHLQEVLEFAKIMNSRFDYRVLAWHLYRHYALLQGYMEQPLPQLLEPFGVESGKLYLLVGLSLLPVIEARVQREHLPTQFAVDACKRLGPLPFYYEVAHDGHFGIKPESLRFLLHYRDQAMFRIGRFDFYLTKEFTYPEIYRKGSEIKAFCPEGWNIDANDEQTDKEDKIVRTTHIVTDGATLTGTPIDLVNGKAMKSEETIQLSDWTLVSKRGTDWMLHFHIPGGGGMKPELSRQSFRDAIAFFKKHFPDKPVSLIMSNSWIFNPDLMPYIPGSNMDWL